ncbi:putative cyclic nucleotide-gated ion channel 15 [Asimina triloba]
MAYGNSKSVRFQDDLELANFKPGKGDNLFKLTYKINGKAIHDSNAQKFDRPQRTGGRSLKAKVLSRVFSEDYERVKQKILDPRGTQDFCIDIGKPLEVVLTIIRSIADVFYTIQISVRFRTAFVAPSSRVFGRGELVIDPSKIASRYLAKSFWIDLISALPLPQVLIWLVIPNLKGSIMTNTKNVLRFCIIFQYLPRLFLIFPLSSQIVKATGVVTETAWAGAAYNLMLYMLASHELAGTSYQLSGKNRVGEGSANFKARFVNAVNFDITSAKFINKYFYCLWWGLRNLSCLGQNLSTSTYVGEIGFAIIIAILGLVLFALLIGNMQTYLQSTTVRLEEWRIRRMDTEQWMRHRQLPPELKQCVRRYDQYKWVATRGVDEEALLRGLPLDLRRDIKRHLCLDLVRRVPLFDQMDERMLDAICERLKPALCTQGTCLVREGDPVNEMLFIIRGHLDSFTTNGGRTGFFNTCLIGPGDFCGEELLTWALDPRPSVILPSSTRTVRAISEVEAFALSADDLKFVASQFRRLHSKQLRHKFRFYSHQWRTWAACFIQAAWRRFKKRSESGKLMNKERVVMVREGAAKIGVPAAGATGLTMGIAGYAARIGTSSNRKRCGSDSDSDSDLDPDQDPEANCISTIRKPAEPDFTGVDEE